MKRPLFFATVAAVFAWAAYGGAARADDPPAQATIPDGVSIGTVYVGGLTTTAAAERVRAEFALPLVITFGTYIFEASPESLATPAIEEAVGRALTAPSGTSVPLQVVVNRARVRSYVNELAERLTRSPVNARLYLRGLRPWISPERAGRRIDRAHAERTVGAALAAAQHGPVALKATVIRPRVTKRRLNSEPVIVIRRASHRLHLYRGARSWRLFGVATGTTTYPTPLGRFHIVVKWKNPWWYPPDSPWAKDKEPVPPGPGNPLGTRWMGISSPGVGIHGTPEPGSIGYSVSHGCVRMRIPDAEWLFEHVQVGTTVFIVGK